MGVSYIAREEELNFKFVGLLKKRLKWRRVVKENCIFVLSLLLIDNILLLIENL